MLFQVFQLGLTLFQLRMHWSGFFATDSNFRFYLFILQSNEPIPILIANLFSSYYFYYYYYYFFLTFIKCLFCSVTGQTNLEQTNKQPKIYATWSNCTKQKHQTGWMNILLLLFIVISFITLIICMSALCLYFLYWKLLTPRRIPCVCKHIWQ